MIQKSVNFDGVAVPISAVPLPPELNSAYPDQIAAELLKRATNILAKEKSLEPAIFAISPENSSLFAIPFPDAKIRNLLLGFLKVGKVKLGFSCIACVSEAWMSTAKEGQPTIEVVPSEDPNRKECLMVYVVMESGQKASLMAYLARDEEGVATLVDEEGNPCPYGIVFDDNTSWLDKVWED